MFSQYFGQYLLNQGILTPQQLSEALTQERMTRVKIGILAINAGYLTAPQVRRIHELQQARDKKFGEIAVAEGLLTVAQVEELLEKQNRRYLNLCQTLVDKEFMSLDKLEVVMRKYKEDSQLSEKQLDALQRADYEEIVRLFFDFADSGPYEQVFYDYVALFLRNIVRLLDEHPLANHASSGLNICPMGEWVASQNFAGYLGFRTGVVMDERMLLELARRFSGEELEKIDELALDSIAEFLNVTNGIFAVNMSDLGLELDLLPQRVGANDAEPVAGKCYCVPIDLSFGSVTLMICPNS